MKYANIKKFLDTFQKERWKVFSYRTETHLWISTPFLKLLVAFNPSVWLHKNSAEALLARYAPNIVGNTRLYEWDVPATAEGKHLGTNLEADWNTFAQRSINETVTPTPYLYEYEKRLYRVLKGQRNRVFVQKAMLDCIDDQLFHLESLYAFELLDNGWLRILAQVATTSKLDAGQYAPVAYIDANTLHGTQEGIDT